MKWFRIDNDLVNNPKVQRLPPSQFKALINIWCLASKNGGVIPSVDEVAYALRIRPVKARLLCSKFVELRLIDRSTDGEMTPHNWKKRQFLSDDSTVRTKAYRKRERSKNADVTPPDTDTESHTDTHTDSDTESHTDSDTQRAVAPAPEPPRDDCLVALNFYNEIAGELALPKAISLTAARRKKLRARLEEHGLDGWFNAVNNIRRQPFLQGKNHNGWTMDFDFLLQAKSFPRVLEGFYIGKKFSRFADEFDDLIEQAKQKDRLNEQSANVVYLEPPKGSEGGTGQTDKCSSGELGNVYPLCAESSSVDEP